MDGGINWTSIRYAAFYARPAIYNIATTTTSTTATATTRLQYNYRVPDPQMAVWF